MHREQGHQQHRHHRHTDNRHERSQENGKAAEQFGEYRQPCQEVRVGDAHRLENGDERVGSPGQLSEPVLHESVTNDQAQRNGRPSSYWKSGQWLKNGIAPNLHGLTPASARCVAIDVGSRLGRIGVAVCDDGKAHPRTRAADSFATSRIPPTSSTLRLRSGPCASTSWPGTGSSFWPSSVMSTLSGSNETKSAIRAISSKGAR